MKINEGYKEKGKGRKCNETNEEKESRMVDDSRTGAQCGDSAYAGEGGRGGCGNRSFDTWKAGSQGYTAGRLEWTAIPDSWCEFTWTAVVWSVQ